jgi:hypothetical protein
MARELLTFAGTTSTHINKSVTIFQKRFEEFVSLETVKFMKTGS